MMRPVSIPDLQAMKGRGERIPALTAYDYTSAQIVDAAGIPLILCGDSLGVVILGHDSTIPVTLDEMVHHTRAVARGARRALVVGDLPFLTYQISAEQAMESAGRMLAEAGSSAVKLEGGQEIAPTVARLVQSGIPVVGHVGYTPQSANRFGRPGVQGRGVEEGERLVRDALALEAAGAFAVVLELVPVQLSAEITRRLRIPTIGIGAGVECDGEIQVFSDVFGLYRDFCPRHAKRYLDLGDQIQAAAETYAEEVRSRAFPGLAQTASMDADVLGRVRARLDRGNDSERSVIGGG